MSCGHLLCELIDGPCSIVVERSRGCRPNPATPFELDRLDEVRAVLAAIEAGDREAAVRLAAIIRREALAGRQLLAHVRIEEPELAPALERLCARRR